MRRFSRHIIIAMLVLIAISCRIQPPLKLADDEPHGRVVLGEVVTDITLVWDTTENWRDGWWYGWDETDVANWGEMAYPEPTNYEGRFYAYGEEPGDSWLNLFRETIYANTFRRVFDFGYHDMLLWSNIDSPDGTQTLIVDESDPANIFATTSKTRVGYMLPQRARNSSTHNIPEIFYGGNLDKFYMSHDVEDYDYFDEEREAWVKRLEVNLYPRVYIYLVQVAVYNNRGRITGISDKAVMDALADGVDVRSGHTSNNPAYIVYEMRMKRDKQARAGRTADILGGKLHTFGLCDMEPWHKSRARTYAGSRTDLSNRLILNLAFSNSTDSTYSFDVTSQFRRQAHGGVITIELDADTLTMPTRGGSAGGFDPTINEGDSIIHEFEI